MVIDPDVRGIAKDFGLDARLMQAVVQAEGNIVRAVQCSIPSVQTREQALRVLGRSLVHALSDYTLPNHGKDFIAFFGSRWAPRGVANDPTNLNANWVGNVQKLLGAAVVALLLFVSPAYAVDDCPPGGVKHAALTALDHASMEAAVRASFVGLYHREPSGIPGSGPDDIGWWITTFDHYGAYGDGVCRAGWNAYAELRLSGASSGDSTLGDQPARFLPSGNGGSPTANGAQSPTPNPIPTPLSTVQTCDLASLETLIANLRADVDAGRTENQQFYAEARSKWEQLATFVGKYGPIVAGAIFAGRATAK